VERVGGLRQDDKHLKSLILEANPRPRFSVTNSSDSDAGEMARQLIAAIGPLLLNDRLVALSSTAPGIDTVARLEPLGNGRFQIETPTGNNPPVGEVA